MSEHQPRIGYLRIPPTDQNSDVQANALQQAGCTEPRDEHTLVTLQQQLQAMDITLVVTTNSLERAGGDHDR